ncbi:MAG TPA: rod shape-determining protein MreC [Chitinophagales bacterium]|nr:rod shape-determining protein MreC [Chitinophagales bacterium]
MYNLFRFLLRYHLFILFVLLEGFCFLLIYNSRHYNQVAYINTANALSGKVYKTFRDAGDYLYLRRLNDSLLAENATLRQRLPESAFIRTNDSIEHTDTSGKMIQHFVYVPAHVIRNSVDQPSNLIYLDRGRLQGVTKQTGVVNARGIVGQVINVTDNYAAVMSVLSKDFKVSAKLKKNDYFGNLHWDGINLTTATLEEIPKHVEVQEGDTIVTSGFSELFPRDVMIGTVRKVKAEPDKNFLNISVRLSTDFGNLNYVYVVKNLKKTELHLLDSLVQKND